MKKALQWKDMNNHIIKNTNTQEHNYRYKHTNRQNHSQSLRFTYTQNQKSSLRDRNRNKNYIHTKRNREDNSWWTNTNIEYK